MRASRRQTPIPLRVLAVFGLTMTLGAGCGSGPTSISGPRVSGAPPVPASVAASVAPSATAAAPNGDIPPGRAIADGGGGPATYTFREEWRRALTTAQQWRSGAYLIKAVGDMVNDDGVPNYWALAFIDKAVADAVLRVEIDPWGKVTKTEEVTGSGVISFADQYTKRITYAIIDSDRAITLGKTVLGARDKFAQDKGATPHPRFSALTGSAVDWTYMLFYESTAEYVSAQIDALSGSVRPPK